jgi:hypothetical protein
MSVIAQGISATRRSGREVARYRIPGGQRVVYAHEVTGGQRLVDVPASGVVGQLFTVDSCWRNEWTLASFLADYVAAGERAGCCPVSPDLEAESLEGPDFDEELQELLWRIGRS